LIIADESNSGTPSELSMAIKSFAANVPSLLTSVRLLATSVLVITLIEGGWGLPVFVIACVTDVLDGALARRLHAESEAGGIFDASVDFTLVFSSYLYLSWIGMVSVWFLSLIALSFLKFILSRGVSTYDPLGKYIGTILFVSLGTFFVFPTQFTANWVTSVASCYVLASMMAARASKIKLHTPRAGFLGRFS
jgi:phosphatidylglycerophosphate synthase